MCIYALSLENFFHVYSLQTAGWKVWIFCVPVTEEGILELELSCKERLDINVRQWDKVVGRRFFFIEPKKRGKSGRVKGFFY